MTALDHRVNASRALTAVHRTILAYEHTGGSLDDVIRALRQLDHACDQLAIAQETASRDAVDTLAAITGIYAELDNGKNPLINRLKQENQRLHQQLARATDRTPRPRQHTSRRRRTRHPGQLPLIAA